MFIAVLSIIAKLWKEPKCPSTDEWIKKRWCVCVCVCVCLCVCDGILLGNQKERNLAICNNMDGTRVYYTKLNKSEKDKDHMVSLIYGI